MLCGRMGKPMAESIYNDGSIYKKGLKLFRGPDPRYVEYNNNIGQCPVKIH